MRKNSKNEKVIRAMAIGISVMLMASSPLTALAAEGEGTIKLTQKDETYRKFVDDAKALTEKVTETVR